jgi:hypothetical protein
MTKRFCCNPACRREIGMCMGFCLARDWLRALDREMPWAEVRELYGACALRDEAGGDY